MLKKKNTPLLSDVLIYLTAICFIMDIGSTYTHMGDNMHLASIFRYLPIILLAFRILLNSKFIKSNIKKVIFSTSIIFIYLTLYTFASHSRIMITFLDIVLLCIIYIYSALIESDQPHLFMAFRNIICFVSFFSTIMWLLSILKIILPTSIINVYWGSVQNVNCYYMLHFDREITNFFGHMIVCNRSIFLERAFAGFAFFIGMIYELFLETNPSKCRLAIFIVSIVSTFSITALLCLLITVITYYVIKKRSISVISIVKFFIFIVLLFLAYYFAINLLKIKSSQGRSVSTRMSDFSNGIAAWKESPIFGYGYGNNESIVERFYTGFSNSITMILSRGGIWLALMYTIPLLKGFHNGIKLNNTFRIAFIFTFIIYFSVTAIAFTDIVMYIMVFIGLGIKRTNLFYKKEAAKL